MDGWIVLSVGRLRTSKDSGDSITPEQKMALDALHKDKILLADRVFVINKGGYIGDSTLSEITYAMWLCKPIEYLERVSDASVAKIHAAYKETYTS
jgi:hypothetical protein